MNSSIAKPKALTSSASWSCVVEVGQSFERLSDGATFRVVASLASASKLDRRFALRQCFGVCMNRLGLGFSAAYASEMCGPGWERFLPNTPSPPPLPKAYDDDEDNETGIWGGRTRVGVGPVGARV